MLPKNIARYRNQHTLAQPVSFSGIGIHTGEQVDMTFHPASPGKGIVFRRTDLPDQPEIPATLPYVVDTQRCTTIGKGKAVVHTIEHVMAALRAYQIDNLLIDVSSVEPPVGNGSSDIFVEMIEEAGIAVQEEQTPIYQLEQPVYWSEGDMHVVAIPAEEYRISYTLSYPNCSVLQAQYYSFVLTPAGFKSEIAPCRTFSRYEEVSYLMDRGLIKGGSLSNAVIIKDGAVLSKGGLFFSNEMARHKILDIIGDLALVGSDFLAHVIAIRSGHAANFGFAMQVAQALTREEPSCANR